MARFLVVFCVYSTLTVTSFAQSPSVSTPTAVSLASQSIAALTNGTAITDITLSGNATWISGSTQDTGTVTARALGFSESRVDLAISALQRTEIRTASAGSPHAFWIGSDSVTHAMADHNALTEAAWFFPALGSLSGLDPSVSLSYIGRETRSGVSVQHLQALRYAALSSTAAVGWMQKWSQIDIYLDANTFLPVAATFTDHPDDTGALDIPVEVDFSDYQTAGTIVVPMHVQKFVQGNLFLDISVTGVALNSGLPPTLFSIQQ